jgi:hypothetical protein
MPLQSMHNPSVCQTDWDYHRLEFTFYDSTEKSPILTAETAETAEFKRKTSAFSACSAVRS